MSHPVVGTLILMSLSRCGGSELPTTTITMGDTPLVVEVADEEDERARGLMHRDSLPADRGMLFVYDDVRPRHFWMKDTRIPLSIAFLDAEGTVVRVADMRPFSTERTASLYPARFAVEVNQGWFAEHGIERGTVVTGLPAPAVGD